MIEIIASEMKFDYCIERYWDIHSHTYKKYSYINWVLGGWAEGSFELGNDEIVVINHASGNYLVKFTTVKNDLNDVDRIVFTENSPCSDLANRVYDGQTSQISVNLCLIGDLSEDDIVNLTGDNYFKIGVINVTITWLE